jgi:D,D-heptose 1,7-bisphosphate phosphatase
VLKQALILVGGLGTRLGARTATIPKPLLDVGGRPFLDYLLDNVARHGAFENILLLSGHLGDLVSKRYDGVRWGSSTLKVVRETSPLGTGGALKNAAGLLEAQFLVMNGDSYFDINLLDMVAAPLETPTLVRMAIKRDHSGDRYGRIELERDQVIRFLPPATTNSGPINSGIYAMSRRLIDWLPPAASSLEDGVLPRLAEKRLIEARQYDAYFVDIGVPSDFERAQDELPRRFRRPAAFFDRDGVLNEDLGHVHRIDQFHWIEGAREAIKLCNDNGYLVFVVTNQAGVARGLYAIEDIQRLHEWMGQRLAEIGAHVDAFYFCPHHDRAAVPRFRKTCRRRKPKPGMLLDCLAAWPVDTTRSFLVGDKVTDLAAANAVGIRAYMFQGGNLKDFVDPHVETSAA